MRQNDRSLTENSISEGDSEFSRLWRQLSHNQRRFVVAMRECSTKAEGAKAIELEPDTVYRWPDIVDDAIDLMDLHVKDAAVQVLADAVAKAALIKVSGLDSGDETLRQATASEVMDRVLGRAQQRHEVAGTGEGGALLIQYVNDWRGAVDDADD